MSWHPPTPSVAIAPADAAAMIDAEDLVLRLTVPPEFDTGPTLAGRFRGALGAALKDLREDEFRANPRRRKLWGTPPTFDVFFADPPVFPPRQGPLAAASARPYVLFSECHGRNVTLTLRVFGIARQWLPTLCRAMTQAITNRGLSVIPLSRSKARFHEYDLTSHCPQSPAALPDHVDVRLVTLSPWQLDRAGHIALDAAMLGASVVSRVSGMLAWCGCWLDGDPEEIKHDLSRLQCAHSTLRHKRVPRRSKRQELTLDQDGMEGAVTLCCIGPTLRYLLPIISLVGLGSSTTVGFGRAALFHQPNGGQR